MPVCKKCWWRRHLQGALLLALFVTLFVDPNKYERVWQASVIFGLVVSLPWWVLKTFHHGR